MWPFSLCWRFGIVVIDESHIIKSINTDVIISVRWLQPEFTVIAFGTPLPNGIKDIKGYFSLIQCQDVSEWVARLPEIGQATDINPFECEGWRLERLRLREYAVEEVTSTTTRFGCTREIPQDDLPDLLPAANTCV